MARFLANARFSPRILVVEDDAIVRISVMETLEDAGFDPVEAPDGRAALAQIEFGPHVDLVLTDLHLHGSIDGRQLAERVRAWEPYVPIVVMSGDPDFPGLEVYGPLLEKPCTSEENP